MTSVLFVCHGNICRSPMAEFVLRHMVKEKRLDGGFYIRSAATSTEETGNPVHSGTVRILRAHGIECSERRATRLTKNDYARYDYIIGMDEENRREILRILGGDPDGKVSLLLDFTDAPREIADPWYTGDFAAAYDDISLGCAAFLNKLL